MSPKRHAPAAAPSASDTRPGDAGAGARGAAGLPGTEPLPATPLPHALRLARVLIVDDNVDLLDNLRDILVGAGYTVSSAQSCAEALRVAHGGFEVALVDLRLPDGDGTLLAPRLKEENPDGEVVLLTGFATLESAVAAVRAGACAYLVKPCQPHELLVAVEQAMRQVRLHSEKRDLSRRAQMAEKLAAVGTMTAGLSHEIRNPLNAAALQLSVLERRVHKLGDAEQQSLLEPLQLVRDEIRRLDHILEDFLQFARPREFRAERLPVIPLLERVLDLFEGAAQQRQVRVIRSFRPVPPVAGDEERLRQVVMNLALNALEAVPDGGWLRVSCQPGDDPELVEVVVDDCGPGIPAESRDRVFEPFFTTKAKGSGLGLPIVHAIVTQHGGSITVEDAPEGGARFVLRIPQHR